MAIIGVIWIPMFSLVAPIKLWVRFHYQSIPQSFDFIKLDAVQIARNQICCWRGSWRRNDIMKYQVDTAFITAMPDRLHQFEYAIRQLYLGLNTFLTQQHSCVDVFSSKGHKASSCNSPVSVIAVIRIALNDYMPNRHQIINYLQCMFLSVWRILVWR